MQELLEGRLVDVESGRMPITVRPLHADEGRLYLEIVNGAIRGLAVSHYPPDIIEGWVVSVTDATVRDLMLNPEDEIRLVAELDASRRGSSRRYSRPRPPIAG